MELRNLKLKENLTCGIIIYLKKYNKFILGKSTGNNHYDIPKGMYEKEDVAPINTAIRECEEEFGLTFDEKDLLDLGRFSYNRSKDIHLFLAETDFDLSILSELSCSSYFNHYKTNEELPEISWYRAFDKSEMLERIPKSLRNTLLSNKLVDF